MAQLPTIVAGHGGSGTTTTVTITAAASGNVLVMWFAAIRAAGARTISSVASTNTTWTKLGNQTQAASGIDCEIWFGAVSGGSSGTTVTITMSGTGATLAVRIDEFTGVKNPVIIENYAPGRVFGSNQGTTSPAPFGQDSLLSTGDLQVACIAIASGTAPTVQPLAPWVGATFVANGTTIGIQGDYIPNGGAQNNDTAKWTLAANVSWVEVNGGILSQAGPQADYVKSRLRSYESPDSEIWLRRTFPFTTAVAPPPTDTLSWRKITRSYDSPDVEYIVIPSKFASIFGTSTSSSVQSYPTLAGMQHIGLGMWLGI